jgi:UDP-N-acetylmuramoyl-L-alanyl-D-glutamate--2,6-diaminopimelate ligase
MMAAGAARLADLVIVTDDNPRSEDPAAIRADMMAGIEVDGDQVRAEVVEMAGREAALQMAIARAQQADVVLALGKGHERTQEINGELFPLDDREVLALAIAERIGVASAGSDG